MTSARGHVEPLQVSVWHFVAAAMAYQFRQFEVSAACLNIPLRSSEGADFQVVARNVHWKQVRERGVHVRMARIRSGRGMREASVSSSRLAIREIRRALK